MMAASKVGLGSLYSSYSLHHHPLPQINMQFKGKPNDFLCKLSFMTGLLTPLPVDSDH